MELLHQMLNVIDQINMKLYAQNSIVKTVVQNVPKIPGFDDSFSTREGAKSGLLIRHALTCVQKFKSSTLRRRNIKPLLK